MTEPKWRRYLRFWKSDPRADAEEELSFHIESRIAEFRAMGMSEEAASAEAMRRFGDVQRTRSRLNEIVELQEQDRRRADMWDALQQDLRYAGRALRRNPGFTLVAALTLALGIGANTAIFSVINGVLLRPLPYPNPGRLVRVFTSFRGSGTERYAVSQPEFMDYKGLTQVFENAAAFSGTSLTLTGDGEPERLRGMAATYDLLPVLGIKPLYGRNFEPREGREGVEPVVIVTHELWQNRFGGDRSLLGRALQINGRSRRVVGILAPGVTAYRAQAFIPHYINPDSLAGRATNYLSVVARLQPGISVERAKTELEVLTRRTGEEFKTTYPSSMGYSATAVSMLDEMVGDIRLPLMILMGAVGLVLLIACANVANLLLARAEARQQEVAVRIALGANGRRILRQLLTESTVLALIGAAGGMLLAWWGMKALLSVNPEAIPRFQEIRLDATVGIVTLVLAMLTGMLFGFAPALHLVRTELQSTLKEGGRGGTEGGHRQRLGRTLVTAEVALAIVVVIGAALLLRSFRELRGRDPGFRAANVLAVDLSLPLARYDNAATTSFYQRLVEQMGAIPGVRLASAASDIPPIAGGNNWDIAIDGRVREPGSTAPSPNVRAVTRDYFRTMSITIAAGRSFGTEDHAASAPVAVLNETSARAWWPNVNPVGQRIRFDTNLPWVTIVGVARDAKSNGVREPTPPELFVLHEQLPAAGGGTERTMYLLLQTTVDPLTLRSSAREAVRQLDPQLAITNIRSMEQLLDFSVAQQRFMMLLLAVFGAVALSLAAIGIYGIMSYAVKRRSKEIGIRMALGGAPRDVLLLVVGQGMRLAVLGLVLGIVVALATTRVMTDLLFGVQARDPLTFVGIALLLSGVAFVASWLPARRAVRTDPTKALRTE
jgi:putative ABC transport system permease protein